MHTTHDTTPGLRRRSPRRLPLYYRGRKAEIWIAACDPQHVQPRTEGPAR